MRIEQIWRYPLKGFRGQTIANAYMHPDAGIPFDRLFAICSGNIPGDPQPDEFSLSRMFIQNAVYDGLLSYGCIFDAETKTLTLIHPEKTSEMGAITLQLDDAESLHKASQQIQGWFETGPYHSPEFVQKNHNMGHWDYQDSAISLINLESVKDIARRAGIEIDPHRFRGNLYISGLGPWTEFNLVGCRIMVGDAEFEVVRPIERCVTTSLNQETCERDFNMPGFLMQTYGHNFCGLYLRAIREGEIKAGDIVDVVSEVDETIIKIQAPSAPDMAKWPRPAKISAIEDIDSDHSRLCVVPCDGWPLQAFAPGDKLRLHLHAHPSPHWSSFHVFEIGANGAVIIDISKADPAFVSGIERYSEHNQTLLLSGPIGGRSTS